jgi:Family of unknown function (DUF6384)
MTAPDAVVPASDTQTPAPLEELMVAMDVVDTMRHRQILVDRELNADARRAKLRERLREIYAAQGIEVSDEALDAGIAALEEERFSYTPVEGGFSIWLAKLYVARARWGRRVGLLAAFAAIVFAVWFIAVGLPAQRLRAELPAEIANVYARIVATADDDAAVAQARELNGTAQAALAAEDYGAARASRDRMRELLQHVAETYEVRIVAGPNELSGVWRVPDINESARNYYLIVEAVSPSGEILRVPILNEEDGQTRVVQKWGLHVSETTFEAVAADKRDDGIIQDKIIGTKPVGRLSPEYRVPTSGGTITDW